jgi:CopG family transcriptional regulator, nickel-responsive regulator
MLHLLFLFALRRGPYSQKTLASKNKKCYFYKKGATMKKLTRFGVSIDTELINRFDRWIESTGYRNRSEAFRDLIRARLVEENIRNASASGFGVFTLVYDHHKRELEEKLTDLQHHHHKLIIATTHVHIDHDNCLEVILLKGTIGEIQNITKSLSSLKGVKHSKLTLTSPEHL